MPELERVDRQLDDQTWKPEAPATVLPKISPKLQRWVVDLTGEEIRIARLVSNNPEQLKELSQQGFAIVKPKKTDKYPVINQGSYFKAPLVVDPVTEARVLAVAKRQMTGKRS